MSDSDIRPRASCNTNPEPVFQQAHWRQQGSSALEPSDSEIIRAVLAGKSDLYGLLFARYRRMVVAFAAARVGSIADAEAIAQEAFVKGYRSLDRLTSPDRFSSWLLKITSNLCKDWLASATRRPVFLEDLADHGEFESGLTASLAGDPVESALRREMGERIVAAIAELSEPFRTTASLRFLQGLSCKEIATNLNEEIGTITMRLSRASRRLREALAEHDPARDGATARPRKEKSNVDRNETPPKSGARPPPE